MKTSELTELTILEMENLRRGVVADRLRRPLLQLLLAVLRIIFGRPSPTPVAEK